MSAAVIRTRGLSKRYGSAAAVTQLDLEVRAGEVFGLLGPNGSGKTTTILMLLGLSEPTAGEIEVLGLDPRRQPISVKRRVGYLPDAVGFYDELSARQNLRYSARLSALPKGEAESRIERALARMGLAAVADRRVATYSRGMRQRLGLAEILLREPQVAILDEPTLGLDPEGAREFLQTVRALRSEGMTVLLCSHLLHQVQVICDRVGLFHRGRMVLQGPVEALAREVLGAGWRVRLHAEGAGVERSLGRVPGVRAVAETAPNTWRVDADADVRAALVQAALASGARVLGMDMEHPGLDEVYARCFQERGDEA